VVGTVIGIVKDVVSDLSGVLLPTMLEDMRATQGNAAVQKWISG
jgi:hypothetical protein